MGYQFTRGANVAYSLYGSKSVFGGCSKSTFINSFYTLDGLTAFATATGISLDSLYTYGSSGNGNGGEGQNKNENGGCTSALTCGSDKKVENSFIQATFTDGMCLPSGYSETTDTLTSLNKELEKQSCVKISVDTVYSLLTYSQSCTALSGSQCPDPHGILADCEQKYQEFEQFVVQGGRDPSKTTRFVWGSLLYVAAFLIYGFAVIKKEKFEEMKNVDSTAFVSPSDSDAVQQDLANMDPAPTPVRTLSIQHAAASFAKTVSLASRSVSNAVKEALEDDDDDEVENPVESVSIAKTLSSVTLTKTASYAPPNSQEYVGETKQGSSDNVGEPTSTDGDGLPPKPKKKSLLKKFVRLFK